MRSMSMPRCAMPEKPCFSRSRPAKLTLPPLAPVGDACACRRSVAVPGDDRLRIQASNVMSRGVAWPRRGRSCRAAARSIRSAPERSVPHTAPSAVGLMPRTPRSVMRYQPLRVPTWGAAKELQPDGPGDALRRSQIRAAIVATAVFEQHLGCVMLRVSGVAFRLRDQRRRSSARSATSRYRAS
jgi:uncharacterized Zn-binding protein involved in type VI secretion